MNQKYIDKETNEQNFQDALINNDGIWQAVFFTCQNICKSIYAKRGLRIKSVGFGLKEAKAEYEKVKDKSNEKARESAEKHHGNPDKAKDKEATPFR